MSRAISRKHHSRLSCPHCGSGTVVRTSEEISELTRENRHQCLEVECGHTFVSVVTITRTIVPSRRPNPAVNIPLTKTSASASAPCAAPS